MFSSGQNKIVLPKWLRWWDGGLWPGCRPSFVENTCQLPTFLNWENILNWIGDTTLEHHLGQLRDHLAPLEKWMDNTWAPIRIYATLAPLGDNLGIEDFGTTSTLQCESLFYLKIYSLPKSCSSRCALDFFFSLLLDKARLTPSEKSFLYTYNIIFTSFLECTVSAHYWFNVHVQPSVAPAYSVMAFSCFYQKSPSPDDPCTMFEDPYQALLFLHGFCWNPPHAKGGLSSILQQLAKQSCMRRQYENVAEKNKHQNKEPTWTRAGSKPPIQLRMMSWHFEIPLSMAALWIMK